MLGSFGHDAVLCRKGAVVAVFIMVNVVLCRVVTAELGLAFLLPRLPLRQPAVAVPTIKVVIVVASRRNVRLLKLYNRPLFSWMIPSQALAVQQEVFRSLFEMSTWRGGSL